MAHVERCLDLPAEAETDGSSEPVAAGERAQLRELVDRLAEPRLDPEARLGLVARMRDVLNGDPPKQLVIPPVGMERDYAITRWGK